MSVSALRATVRADAGRYVHLLDLDGTAALPREVGAVKVLRALAICQGLQATLVHRVGHELVRWQPASPGARVVRLVGRVLHFVANRFVEASTGISIAERATIGPGLYIGHFGGVIIGAVTMGANCTVSHGITIGRSGRTGENTRPTLGDRVWVGPGAVITGAVVLGDDSVVGANSVVTRDVPARATAVGAPARVLPGRPSFDMVVYPGQDDDPGRAASVAALRVADARLADLERAHDATVRAAAQDA